MMVQEQRMHLCVCYWLEIVAPSKGQDTCTPPASHLFWYFTMPLYADLDEPNFYLLRACRPGSDYWCVCRVASTVY